MSTLYATDSFSRSNSSSWGLASDGTNTWAQVIANNTTGGAASWALLSNGGEILNSGENVLLCGATTSGDTEVLVRQVYSDAYGTWGGAMARSSSNGQSGYQAIQTSGTLGLYRRDNVAYNGALPTALATASSALTAGNAYWIRLRVTGAVTPLVQARIWQDGNTEPGTWTVSATDSSGSAILGSGQAGVYSSPWTQASDLTTAFSAWDLTIAVTTASFEDDLSGSESVLGSTQALFSEGLTIAEAAVMASVAPPMTYTDTFAGRTVSSGWGTASDGVSSWTTVGTAANFAVASGEGTVTSAGGCTIGSTQTTGEILVRFQIPDGSSLVEMRLRYTNASNFYALYLNPGLSRIFKMVAGTFTSLGVSGLGTAVAGQYWWARFQISGSTLKASVWKDGNTEPALFQTSVVESSLSSGLPMLYGSGTGTSVMSFDHFSFTTAITLPLIASELLTVSDVGGWQSWPVESLTVSDSTSMQVPPVFSESLAISDSASWLSWSFSPTDTFIRPDQSGWGLASDGVNSWTQPIVNTVAGGTPDCFISGDRGRVGNTGENVLLCGTLTNNEEEVLLLGMVSDALLSGIGAVARSSSDGKTSYQAILLNGSLGLYARRGGTYSGSPAGLLASASVAPNAGYLYWLRLRVTGATSPLLQARIWQDGTAEPSAWTLATTDQSGSPLLSGQVGIYLNTQLPTSDYAYTFAAIMATNETLPAPFEDDLAGSETLLTTLALQKTHSLSIKESAILASLSTAGIPPGVWEDDLAASEAANFTETVSFLPPALTVSSSETVSLFHPLSVTEGLSASDGALLASGALLEDDLAAGDLLVMYSFQPIRPATTSAMNSVDLLSVAESATMQVGAPLVLALTNATSQTISLGDQLYSTIGSPATVYTYFQIGTGTGWGELLSHGSTTVWPGLTAPNLVSLQGWFLDGSVLDNRQLIGGLWSASLTMQAWQGTATTGSAAGTLTADLILRAWKYTLATGDTSLICALPLPGITISATQTITALPPLATLSGEPFLPGERLYLDLSANIKTNANGAATQMIRLCGLSTDTANQTGSSLVQITTPGTAALIGAVSTWGLGIYGSTLFAILPLTTAPVEALSLAESRVVTEGAVFIEAVAGTESLLVTGGVSALDAGAIAESPTWAGAQNPQEALAATESVSVQGGNVPLDAGTVMSVPMMGDLAQFAESLPSLETSAAGSLPLFVESLSIADAFLGVQGSPLVEGLIAQETLTATEAGAFSETGTALSVLLAGEGFLAGEALGASEGSVFTPQGAFQEGGSCTESLSRTESVFFAESLAGASTFFLFPPPTASLESLTVSETPLWQAGVLPQETVSASEGASWQEAALFSDLLSSAESPTMQLLLAATESLTAASTPLWQAGVLSGEALLIAETVSTFVGILATTYTDSFVGRTVSNGWGTASDGVNSWTIVLGAAANFAVGSGEGTITSTGTASIGATQTDGEVLVRFQIPDASSQVGIRLRYANSSNFYVLYLNAGLSRIFKTVAGTQTNLNVTGLGTAVASQYWWARFQIQGSTLRASVWKDGTGEPVTFQTSVVDASLSSGLALLQASGLSTSVMSFDSFGFSTALSGKMAASELLTPSDALLQASGVSLSEGLAATESLLRAAPPARSYQTIGQASDVGGWESAAIGPGAVGGTQWYYLGFVYATVGDLVVVDPTNNYATSVYHSPVSGEFSIKAITAGADGNVYCGTAGTARFLKFTPSARTLTDLGSVPNDPSRGAQAYIWESCLSGYDSLIYGATYPGADLVRLNTTTGVSTNLGTVDAANQYARHLVADPIATNPYIYLGTGSVSMKIVAYNLSNGAVTTLASSASSGFARVWIGTDGNAYGSIGSTSYSLSGGVATIVGTTSAPPPATFANGNTIGPVNLGLPNQTVRVVWASDGSAHSYPLTYSGEAAALFALGAGPDGNIYGSTVLPGYLTTYQPSGPQAGVSVGYEIVSGELYRLLGANGKLYMGAYGGQSGLLTYDPAKPISPIPYYPNAVLGSTPPPNPTFVSGMPDDWRITALVWSPSDSMLYAGSVGEYGQLNGPLIAWNPTSQAATVSSPISNQGVWSIALSSTVAGASGSYALVCGSTIGGGGGTTPTATNAQVFTWDPLTATLLHSYSVPGAGNVGTVNDLVAVGSLIYGIASTGYAFSFNPATGTFPTVVSFPYTISSALYNGMALGSDGNLWGVCDQGVFTLNATTLAPQLRAGATGTPTTGFAMTLDPVLGDTLYYAVGSAMTSYGPPPVMGLDATPIEALSISDAMTVSVQAAFGEALSLGESAPRTGAYSTTEPLALSEQMLSASQMAPTEARSLLDTILLGAGWVPLEISPIGDSVGWQSWGFDVLSVGDSFSAGRGAQLLDGLTGSESANYGAAQIAQDALSVSDMALAGQAISFADILGIVSSRANGASLVPVEGLPCAEALLVLGSEAYSELLVLAESGILISAVPPVGNFLDGLLARSSLLAADGTSFGEALLIGETSSLFSIGGVAVTVTFRDGAVTAVFRDGTVIATVR